MLSSSHSQSDINQSLFFCSLSQRHARADATSPNANLGVLLLEFLELYGCNFNYYNTAIRVTHGGEYVPKEQMKDLENGARPSLLCIEDPLAPGTLTTHCFILYIC